MSDPAVSIARGFPGPTVARVPQRLERSGDRVLVLDGTRGIAVLLVMTYHFWIRRLDGGSQPWTRALRRFRRDGLDWCRSVFRSIRIPDHRDTLRFARNLALLPCLL